MARRKAPEDGSKSRPVKSYRQTTFPKPPNYKMTPEVFGEWLQSFPAEDRARLQLTGYRDWPVIDRRLIEQKHERRIFQFDSTDSTGYFEQMAVQGVIRDTVLKDPQWGGSGKYRILANEAGVPGLVGLTAFTITDHEFPPKLDVRTLVLGHPENKGYIETLRASGQRMPGDDPAQDKFEEEEQQEMNVASTLAQPLIDRELRRSEKLEETIDKLQDELRDRRSDAEPSATAHATAAGIEVMKQATSASIEMVKSQANEVVRAAAPSYNPVELFRAGMEAKGGNDGVTAMFTLFLNFQEKQAEQMRQMHHETMETFQKITETAPETTAVARTESNDSFIDKFEEMKKYAEFFGWERRPRGESAAPVPNKEPGFFDKIGKFVADNPTMALAGLGMIASIFYNLRGGGPAVSPQVALEAAGIPKNAIPSMPGAQPPPQPTPQPAQPTEADRQAARERFMNFLTPHFLNHYNNAELNGFTFAADLHTMTEAGGIPQIVTGAPATPLGRQQYEQIVKIGPAQFDRVIRDWAPIWSVISNSPHSPTDPEHYAKFFKEFFGYDEYAKQQAGVVQ